MQEEQIREALNKHWQASAAGDANAEHDFGRASVVRSVAVDRISRTAPIVSPRQPRKCAVCVLTCVLAPARNQLPRRGRPLRKKKLEASGEQTAGHDAAALENEFRLGPHEPRADFNDPFRVGQAKADAPRVAQGSHEITIGERVG
jgi:hypothetical protein